MRNSYASKILRMKGMRIYSNGLEILNKPYNREHPRIITRIVKNTDFIRSHLAQGGYREITDVNGVWDLKMKISKFHTSAYFKGQKIGYHIIPFHTPEREEWQKVDVMPAGHYVIYDAITRSMQGVGKNFGVTGRSEWYPIDVEYSRQAVEREANYFDLRMNPVRKQFAMEVKGREVQNYFVIPEGLVGISENGYYVCIPKPEKSDPHFVVIFGGRRMGKSLLENALEDIYFHKFKCYCANINDLKRETRTRCQEWEEKSPFKTELKRFGEPSSPKPCVYLHPKTHEEYPKIHYQEVGYDVSLPLSHLLRDDKLITYNSDWDMSGSATQLAWRNLIRREGQLRRDGLAFVNTQAEAYNLIDTTIMDKGMNSKAKRVISDIFNTNMTDKSSKIASKWVLQYKEKQEVATPWNTCMSAGLFPYLITSNIRKRELWFALWLRYVIEDILNFANNQEAVTEVFLDEIEELLKYGVTRQIIERAIRECAQQHLGFIMVAHNYKYVKDAIYTHTTGMSSYKFIFNTAESDLINALKKEGLSRQQAEDIPHLQQFQCYAFGNFVLYDTDGNKMSNEGKPIKIIKVRPPNCQHYGG